MEELAADVPQMLQQVTQLRELYGIKAEEAGQAFERVLASGEPQIIVSSEDLQGVIDQQNALTATSFMNTVGGVAGSVSDADFVAPINEIEATIAAVWQNVFGIERIGRHDNFFDLGGHSLLAIQLMSEMREVLEIDELPLSSLFERPTVAQLAEIVDDIEEEEEEDTTAEELEALLMEIEGLSDEELEAALLTAMDL